MEQRATAELLALLRDALKIGGAPIEMRTRKFASALRASDAALADAVTPLLISTRSLRSETPIVPAAAPVDSDSRMSLLKIQDEVHLPRPPIFEDSVRDDLARLIKERRSADRLIAAGLQPIRSVLLCGQPGVGKTMSAAWLAQQLSLPLLTLDLATVVSSYLGKTGTNVRAALDYAQKAPCVLLLDEFDAIAKRRDDDRDVGELKRLVTVLLQAVDEWSPTSLLVAATNHGELLDPAIWRRFDMTIEIPLPSFEQRLLLLLDGGVDRATASVVAKFTEGASADAIARAIVSAQKSLLLHDAPVSDSLVSWAGRNQIDGDGDSKPARDLEILRRAAQGMTSRQIGLELDISHSTVNRLIKAYKE
jgi:MoxR-like ATPase